MTNLLARTINMVC